MAKVVNLRKITFGSSECFTKVGAAPDTDQKSLKWLLQEKVSTAFQQF